MILVGLAWMAWLDESIVVVMNVVVRIVVNWLVVVVVVGVVVSRSQDLLPGRLSFVVSEILIYVPRPLVLML